MIGDPTSAAALTSPFIHTYSRHNNALAPSPAELINITPYGQDINYYMTDKPTLVGMHISIPGTSGERNNTESGSYSTSIVSLTIKSRASKPYVQTAIHSWVMQ